MLEIDTFLLSCRVLGRGVEHAMLNALGEIAGRRQVSLVAANLIPTAKNQPARDFLEEAAGGVGSRSGELAIRDPVRRCRRGRVQPRESRIKP